MHLNSIGAILVGSATGTTTQCFQIDIEPSIIQSTKETSRCICPIPRSDNALR